MRLSKLAVRALCLMVIAAVPGLPSLSSPVDLQNLEMRVHRKVNQERSSRKLPALRWNGQLALEARRHAANMARHNFFDHDDPRLGDLADRLDRSGIGWSRCAENLYEEKGVRGDIAGEAVKAWLGSPGHRKNMLDSRFSHAGVGAAVRKDGTVYIVQNFVSR